MTLRLYNTLTRAKEDFAPLDARNVRMYVCGPTVYDFAHIGNARPVIVFDLLFRLLRHMYGAEQVTYVRNITDIDDKINARAQEVKGHRAILDAVRELTATTGRIYHEDVAALGCLPPTHEPRATEYVPRMISLIGRLIAQGLAYEADGHVLFDVSAKEDYGKLAHRTLDEMVAGARVEVAPYKRGPMDFVLWKPSDASLPGWESPWGRGRPGWHIECSAMGEALLGETFDIHGGGIDLVFPHHENEIAQSEGVHNGHALARLWMHNGFLNVEGEKMSKSLGNFVTIRELLHIYPGDVLRLQMLGTHYRSPIDWTHLSASQARSELLSWADVIAEQDIQFASLEDETNDEELLQFLYEDLNTPMAIARLREKFRELKREWSADGVLEFAKMLKFLGFQRLAEPGYFESVVTSRPSDLSDEARQSRTRDALSFQVSTANNLIADAEQYREKLRAKGFTVCLSPKARVFVGTGPDPQKEMELQISSRIGSRNAARNARDFKEADRIRDELLQQGIQLKDNPDGTTSWDVKR